LLSRLARGLNQENPRAARLAGFFMRGESRELRWGLAQDKDGGTPSIPHARL
jgi:hypothetical protein